MGVNTGKYFITEPKPGFEPEFFGRPAELIQTIDLAFLDNDVLKGGSYVQAVWFFKGSDEIAVHPHVHDFDEILGFFGCDPEHPRELGGQVENTIDGEEYVMTESGILFVPKGVLHGPLYIRRVDRPFFHFATGNTALYHGEKRETAG
jgi:hypothetical protein